LALSGALRLAHAGFGRVTDGDEAQIAGSALALARGEPFNLYEYPEHVGYYHFADAVDRILPGGGPARIRDVMIAMSAVAAALLGGLALLAFPRELSRRARLIFGFVLILVPALWRVAQYGNPATPSVALVLAAFVAASRIAGVRGAALASVLLAAAVLFRIDAVLVAPALAWYAWKRAGGRPGHAAAVLLAVLVGLGLMWLSARRAGARPLWDAWSDVVFDKSRRGWWLTYVYWGLGPTVLLAAVAGWPSLIRMPALWRTALLWVVPPFLFYYPWSTTPRHTLLLAPPVALCAALGVDAVIRMLARRNLAIRVAGLAAVWVLLCQPLFVSQSGAMPGRLPGRGFEWLTPLTYQAADGPHFYGALAMQRWHPPAARLLPRDGAAADLAALAAANAARDERWVVIIDSWDDFHVNAFHLHAASPGPFRIQDNLMIVGKLRLDFCFRGLVDGLGPDTPANQRNEERLRTAARLFRQTTNGGVQIIPKMKATFGELVVTEIPGSGELVEMTLAARASRPASGPASSPASRARR
jgi:hypothetical protein